MRSRRRKRVANDASWCSAFAGSMEEEFGRHRDAAVNHYYDKIIVFVCFLRVICRFRLHVLNDMIEDEFRKKKKAKLKLFANLFLGSPFPPRQHLLGETDGRPQNLARMVPYGIVPTFIYICLDLTKF